MSNGRHQSAPARESSVRCQQGFPEIIGGRLQLVSDNVTSVLPHVTAGRLRALGVTGPRRIPLAPDIPTVAEAGVPGYEITAWGGYMAPAGTPGAIVAKLNAELNRVIASKCTQRGQAFTL